MKNKNKKITKIVKEITCYSLATAILTGLSLSEASIQSYKQISQGIDFRLESNSNLRILDVEKSKVIAEKKVQKTKTLIKNIRSTFSAIMAFSVTAAILLGTLAFQNLAEDKNFSKFFGKILGVIGIFSITILTHMILK